MKQLEECMHDNNLFDPFQSAYRSQHATETAILKINNDILSGLDRDKCTVLASFDLSAAFDTVDYAIFLRPLQNLYEVEQLALQWFTSYLTDRTHPLRLINQSETALQTYMVYVWIHVENVGPKPHYCTYYPHVPVCTHGFHARLPCGHMVFHVLYMCYS